MGTGAGKHPIVGMPLSPTVEYAAKRSRKVGQPLVSDAPALVDLGHGTVRYRKTDEQLTGQNLKTGYFYHTRLDDYGLAAVTKPQDEYKLKYVYKNTGCSRDKNLFYIYGIGFDSRDAKLEARKPYKPKGRGYVWPSSYRKADHLYCDLMFIAQDMDLTDSGGEEEDVRLTNDSDNMRFHLRDTDTLDALKKRLALRLMMPRHNIHISYRDAELCDQECIGRLRSQEDGAFSRFSVSLRAT